MFWRENSIIELVYADSKDFNETFVLIDLDGGILELRESHNATIDFSQSSIRHHLAFETHQFDDVVQLVKANKIPIVNGPREISGDIKLLTVLDPDNNTIDIGQLVAN